MAEYSQVKPGGIDCSEWIELFFDTYSLTAIGLLFRSWPDGACTMDQSAIQMAVFDVIKDEVIKWQEDNNR